MRKSSDQMFQNRKPAISRKPPYHSTRVIDKTQSLVFCVCYLKHQAGDTAQSAWSLLAMKAIGLLALAAIASFIAISIFSTSECLAM